MGNNNSSYSNNHINSKSRLHHDYHRGHGKWGASSDLGDPSSNRMKKGYMPTRGYHGHGPQRLPSPHKVLPSVNPTSAAKLLKPTSNGAILHQGGTISGRKLLSELDPHSPEAEDLRRAMRKRSTASCSNGDMHLVGPASGRSTPNLSVMDYNVMLERNGARKPSSKGGSSSRDYDSEPDLRDMDDHHRDDSSPQRSMSPVPNSFTLIQESPAKKQIRSKKKGKAPPPPTVLGEQLRVGGDMSCCSPHSPQLLSPCGESKKASRLFKTKAESRHAANGPRSPEICSDLEMSRGGMMRASMDANRFFRGDRDRSSVHSIEAGLCTSKSSGVDHNVHLSKRKLSEGGMRKTTLISSTTVLSSSHGGGLSSRNNPEVKNLNMAPLARDHTSASAMRIPSSNTSGGVGGGNRPSSSSNNHNASNIIMINQSGASKDEHVPKSHRVSPTTLIPPIAPYGQSSQSTTNFNNGSSNGNPSVNQKGNKSFISSSSSHTKAAVNSIAPHHQPTNNSNNKSKPTLSNGKVGKITNNNFHHGRKKTTAAPAVPPSTTTANNTNNIHHKTSNNESNKTKFYFGMDAQPPNKPLPSPPVAAVHQSDSDNNNNECPRDEKIDRIIANHHEKVSSTNSELLQIKQDSGSFDISERPSGDGLQSRNRESSSELSSSDLDIPLNIRPTLPAKKLGLPRFSPTAAWRALDSPSRVSVSGRSYSSEEGYGHDRIQRYIRQIPPSRGNNNNHERSAGDSGISAGDAGSPANPELIGDASAARIPSTSNPAPVTNGGRGYKLRDRVSSGKHGARDSQGNKCWTPEQDLDESSSSEYEDHQLNPHHNPPHPVHSGSNVATRVMAAGLGTPPKLTTRNNLFERGRNSALGMVSDSDQHHSDKPGNMYVRSRKAMVVNGSSNGGVGNGKVAGASGQQTHEDIKKSQNGASRYSRNIRSQPWRQPNHLRQPTGNNNNGSREFVGLDTNWFLSRSEPNSLNLIGNGEYDNIEQQELRLVLAEQDDDDEEDELFLPSDEKRAMNMHGDDDHVVSNEYDEVDGCGTRLESEIGYGPSSMSFSSPLPSPSAVKLTSRNINRRKEQHANGGTALVSSNLAEEFERDQDVELASPNVRYGDNNSSWERRPFSHIMYLPAYDSRRASSSVTRRTKSVDNLHFTEMTTYQPRKTSHYNNPISPNVGSNNTRQRHSRSPSDSGGRGRQMMKRGEEEPFERSQSVPPFTAEEENERRRRVQMDQHSKLHQQQLQEQAEQKKKKFKFQSTLRVLERKKIEEQLSRDAEEKERRRLQEQEAMRKVEEEFQKKRVKEKVMEMEAAAARASQNNMTKSGHGHNLDKIEMSNRYDVNFEPRNSTNNGGNHGIEKNSNQNRGNSGRVSYSTNHQSMFQRQEPEGAPASANIGPTGDLRKELICASRTRSGSNNKQSELTQEISEFCTPTGQRQYFDYRRAQDGDGFNRSGPPTRYYNSSSSSDIFPVSSRRDRKRGGGSSVISSSKSSVGYLRPTVHPQVVCDIPVKPLPYTVNFSRLSSSNMDLLTEQDRPRSGLGGNASVLSDNYRKDWAHHSSRGNGPARASSVISLHSAPPLSNSEQFRHSSVDLTTGSVLHTPPQSPHQSKYSTSPSASPVSHSRPLSSPEERFQQNHSNNDITSSKSTNRTRGATEDWGNFDCITGSKTVVMLNSPPSRMSSSPTVVCQAAPYNRQKNFHPVDFNPNSSPGGLSPAHAFHHASAKLTTPTPVV